MTAPPFASLASRLPPELRVAWERVEADASGLLGQTRSINSLVARHRSTFEALIDGGLPQEEMTRPENLARLVALIVQLPKMASISERAAHCAYEATI